MNEEDVKDEKVEAVPMNICPLDETMLAALEEFRQQHVQIEAQRMGAIRLYMRQQNLEGEWEISPDQKSLARKQKQP